ncbi:hypothetical protein, partial [Methylobacterium segetis]
RAQGAEGRNRPAQGEREGRREGGGRRDRFEGGRGRPDRREENRHAGPREDQRPPRRERAPDPDSPFAKLAALKAQLESGDSGKR